MKTYNRILLLCLFVNVIKAQPAADNIHLETGDKMPDIMVQLKSGDQLKNVKLSELYKHQPIILDFWATWCTACIPAIRDADSVSKLFPGKLEVIPVSYEEEQIITPYLLKSKLLKNLKLNYIVNDNAMAGRYFRFNTIPHEVWIDTSGTIKAMTYPDQVNSENLVKFFSGNMAGIHEKKDVLDFDPFARLEISNKDFIYRSILSSYKEGYQGMCGDATIHEGAFLIDRFFAVNMDLLHLFYQAYARGNGLEIKFNKIEFNIKDSLSLMPTLGTGVSTKEIHENLYWYELVLPEKKPDSVFYNFMMDELNKITPYNGQIVKRMKPCWALIVVDPIKVSNLPADSEIISSMRLQGSTMRGYHISSEVLAGYLTWHMDELSVLDETNLTTPFDIKIPIHGDEDDREYVSKIRKTLLEYGFDLKPVNRIQDILVITEKRLIKTSK